MCCHRSFRKTHLANVFDNVDSIYNDYKYNTSLHYSEYYSLRNDSLLCLMQTEALLLTTSYIIGRICKRHYTHIT